MSTFNKVWVSSKINSDRHMMRPSLQLMQRYIIWQNRLHHLFETCKKKIPPQWKDYTVDNN